MVSKFLQPYLASYDLSKMDVQKDKQIIDPISIVTIKSADGIEKVNYVVSIKS